MERLVIIDGNAILHRAYHALPPLTNKDGKITNAVYGFSSMLLKVIADLKPTHLVVTFDRKAPTFRKKLYKDYQAKRPEMEEDLSSQIDMVHNLVKAFDIPIYEMDGYEADDLIGTITWEVDHKVEKIIVTGDRDILQLVDAHTKVFMPVKGLSEGQLFGEKEVEVKMGVKPIQIIDLKALTGDASDNYPGISGIGPKTATTLLINYQTLDNVYNAIKKQDFTSKIPDKVVTRLIEGHSDALLSQKLATILRDVPINFDLNKAKLEKDSEKYAQVLADFGFNTLAKRAQPGSTKQKDPTPLKLRGARKKEENQLGLF